MGLACSNIRLLTLTARKADCELGLSIDSAEKMALTREQSELSQKYYGKMQAKQIAYYQNGQYSNVNYSYLMGYGANYAPILNGNKPLKAENSMILSDYKGQVVLSQSYADAIIKVMGGSIMNAKGQGGTFSAEKIPEILAALIPGVSKEAFQAVMNGENVDNSTYSVTLINTLTGNESGKSEVNNTATKTALVQSLLDFYLPIFKAAASNGWTMEYNEEMQANDNYISDAIVSGTFQLQSVDAEGNYDPDATLTYFVTAGWVTARTDSDTREEITAWYNAEKDRISEKESFLDIEMDELSTELEAINTEIQSLQSLIQDSISSVFDWGSA